MDESQSTAHLATLVSQGLETLEKSARFYPCPRIARMLMRCILPAKASFQTVFKAPPAGTSADNGKFLPIISEADGIPSEHLPEDDIKAKLGQYYPALRASIQDAKISLDSITRALEGAAGSDKGKDPESVASPGSSSIRCWDQSDTEGDDLVPRNPRLAGSPRTDELKQLCSELQHNIDDAIRSQKFASPSTVAPGPGGWRGGDLWVGLLHGLAVVRAATLRPFTCLIAKFYNPAPPSQESGSETHRTTLTGLHTALSYKLKCQCHFVHLGLCSISESLSGSSDKLESPGLIYPLFVTRDLSRYPLEDPLYLKASRNRSGNGSASPPTSIPPLLPTEHPTNCSGIITSPVGSRHYLPCETHPQTEFLVESARPPLCPLTATAPGAPTCNPIPTLRLILTPHSQEGNTIKLGYDGRLLLAARLTHWVLRYYGTPWLRDLDTQEIRFFTRYENDPNCANWTPYISAFLEEAPPECRKSKNELYALGLVLLELGLKKPPDYSPNSDMAKIVKIGSDDLPRTLGVKYKCIVEKLLAEGAKENRLEKEQINGLESYITQTIQTISDSLRA